MQRNKLIWQINDILRGTYSSNDYYEYAVSAAYFHNIFKKYNISIYYNNKINLKEILLKNTNLMTEEEATICRDVVECGFANIEIEALEKFFNIYEDLSSTEVLKLLDEFYEQMQSRSSGMNISIDSVIELSKKLLQIEPDSRVIDMCSGYGKFLLSLNDTNELSGIEINFNTYVVSKMLLYLQGKKVRIYNKDVLQYNFTNEKYDYIFCEAPFGLKVNNSTLDVLNKSSNIPYKFNRNSGSWLFVAQVLKALKQNGKSIVVMNNAPLFQYSDNEFRKYLLETGYLDMVIRLPEKLLAETSISISILVISNEKSKNIKLIDASKEYIEGRRINSLSQENIDKIIRMSEDEKYNISYEEIANNNYNLFPTNYANDINISNPIKIEDLANDIFRGVQISAKMLDEIVAVDDYTYKVMSLSNIDDYSINYNDMQKVKVDHSKWNRYLLEDGDFILSAKGTKIKTAVFENNSDEKVIASGNLMVLRLKRDIVDAYYLKLFLDSKLGQKCINRIQTGAVILSISKQALQSMEIPRSSIGEQKALIAKYKAKIDELNYHKRKLDELTKNINNIFDNELGGE